MPREVTMQSPRSELETYPEEALERTLGRFAPRALARIATTEGTVMVSALRYAFGGFRKPLPPGFSYVRTWATVPLLLAIPLMTIPEMLVLDFVLWHAGAWRSFSDVAHVYAMLWCIGIVSTARTRPHRCDASRVRLRFGCLRRLDLDRSNIARVAVHRTVADPEALRRSLRADGDAIAMTLSGVPAVELVLREPIVTRSLLGRARNVRLVFVAADEPAAFAAALAA